VIALGNGQIALGDCLDVMRSVQAASVDMILCDLPYGTTQNKWDSVIPFEPLWREYWRIAKPNAAVVLTAQCPFDKVLGCSQLQFLKYEWIWQKSMATGFLNAKKQPMKAHENVLVFYREQCLYNPQKTPGKPYRAVQGRKSSNYGAMTPNNVTENSGDRYPLSVQSVDNARGTIHPTQKPVALFEYLIRTYTNEGDTVMDNCMGSGTTAIAAENTGRRWIGIERDPGYFGAACERIVRHQVRSE
jgi:site-specific DNA-methyltransferase (adenine-specific)